MMWYGTFLPGTPLHAGKYIQPVRAPDKATAERIMWLVYRYQWLGLHTQEEFEQAPTPDKLTLLPTLLPSTTPGQQYTLEDK